MERRFLLFGRLPDRLVILLPVFALLLATIVGSATANGFAKPTQPNLCTVTKLSSELSEPPDVDVSSLPIDASGERELIIGVHSHGDVFCYRYTLNGVTYIAAPTIRVHRGEHFALRIANDIRGQSKGEFAASSSLPPCKPMSMPEAHITHYVGYLNHTLDDIWMPKLAVDTNIHLHGFEGPASEENVFLSTLSTPMHACEYHITIPKTQPP
jgi:hypothetical protein